MSAALRISLLILAASGSLAGCASDRPDTVETSFSASAPDTTMGTIPSPAGLILTDGLGRALYVRVPDGGAPAGPCTGECDEQWPAYAADGVPAPARGTLNPLRTDAIGTAPGAAGGDQVTYAERPLHRFAGDTAPGRIGGQGVRAFGGTWMLVAPSGEPVRPPRTGG